MFALELIKPFWPRLKFTLKQKTIDSSVDYFFISTIGHILKFILPSFRMKMVNVKLW